MQRSKAELELKARRGGKRQKAAASSSLAEEQHDSEVAVYDSVQGLSLIEKHCIGAMPAVEVQRQSDLALKDQLEALKRAGVSNPKMHASTTLQALAGLGTSGKHKKNCDAELVSMRLVCI